MPPSSLIEQCDSGWIHNKRLAKSLAAYNCVKKLVDIGALSKTL